MCNPEYAKRLGIEPSVRQEYVKGLLIDEAALITKNFEQNMNAMLGCWMGVDELPQSQMADLLDVTKWIGDKYIPSFINTSNQDIWFLDSANALAETLERNGTDYELFYRKPECDVLNHGYMQLFASNAYARECFEHMLAFIVRRA